MVAEIFGYTQPEVSDLHHWSIILVKTWNAVVSSSRGLMRTMTVLPASMVPRSSRSSELVMAPLLEKGDRWVERVLSLRETCRLRSLPAYPVLVEALTCSFQNRTPDVSWI